MKSTLKFVAFILLTGVLFLISCQKELSCEGCGSNPSSGSTNKPPIANAGPDQTILLPIDSVKLDGSLSIDPDGTITSYKWIKISGPASSNILQPDSSKTLVKTLVMGVYKFELTVRDNGGLSAKDTVQIIVSDPTQPNRPPVARAGVDKAITLPTNTLNLDGSASTDPDNNITSYAWTKISGPSSFNIANANAVQTQITNLVEGTYQFELKVTDAGALLSKDTLQIIVNDPTQPNRPPVARAGADKTITLPTNTLNLDGSGSTDPDNNITSYAWTKISGPSSFNIANANTIQTQVTNLVEGIYQFELKVTDAGALFSKDTMQVIVSQAPACTSCKIVFVSSRDGNEEIYSCNANGSNIQRLTNNAGSDGRPAWSPNGTLIAFISDRTGTPELYIMNADGSNVVRKTFSGIYDLAWSPDGTKIAYSTVSNGSSNIWLIGAASGSTPMLLFEEPGWEGQPAWSPNGTKIALASDWAAYDFVSDIYTINVDGTGFTALNGINIFDHFDYYNPSWSPGGTKLAMAIVETIGINQYNTQVGVINADGSALTAILSGAAAWTKTSWSGDGTKIAYTSLSGARQDISWVSANGATGGTIVTNGWDANWQH